MKAEIVRRVEGLFPLADQVDVRFGKARITATHLVHATFHQILTTESVAP